MPSLLTNLRAPETVSIACYHCGTRQEVGRKAQTVTCKQCHKALQVSDVQVKRYDARREIKTVGTVVVEKKGQIVADTVVCSGLVGRGQVKAKNGTTVRGAAMLGPKAQMSGPLRAFTLSMTEGAEFEGDVCIGKDDMVAPKPTIILEDEAFPDAARVDAPASPVLQRGAAPAEHVAG